MADRDRREHQDAGREARDAVAAPNRVRPALDTVRVALARYLAGEYHGQQRARRVRPARPPKT